MILLALLLQTTPVQPILRGTALPPPASEEGQVLAPVQRMFDALAAGNGAAFLAEVRPDGRATALVERPDGTRLVRTTEWTAFAERMKPGADRPLERLVGQPAIEIDGDIAMVWAPYDFTLNGKLSHCGVNHFDMVREGGAWKVLNVTWTQRTTGCPAR
jgi:hypothetical protein